MFAELIEWTVNLDREFAFLLLLPFAVALAGFAAELANRRTPHTKASHRGHPESSGQMPPGAWSRGL
jgi:hypothetical protein